ncbi:uncharacterized protein LOC124118199 isoform X3 [Haliotis rufescens]|uniref:uncharacterized protein LOC124118199 isoform X3 n=1 Tax=Haliotis rufescens TaxID=6454 RepID=UPI00201F9A9D|nr:uncharacterized protein LOC124118199 isoform X3 [Haliotis rufescens]
MQSAVLLLFCSVMSVGLGSNGFYFWDRTEVGINLGMALHFPISTVGDEDTQFDDEDLLSGSGSSDYSGSTTTESRETTTAPAKTKSTGSTTTESRQTTTARPKAEQHHQSRATSPDSTKADQRVSTSRSTGTVGDKTDITDETRPYLIGGLIGSGLVLLLVAIALGVVIKRRASRRNEHLLDDDVSDANHQIQHIQRLIS